jgi:hypothetical protein
MDFVVSMCLIACHGISRVPFFDLPAGQAERDGGHGRHRHPGAAP